MKNELENIYANQVLISESKTKEPKLTKKNDAVKGGKGATKMGNLEGAEKATPKEGATEKVKKELKTPMKKEYTKANGGTKEMKENMIPNTFDQIFQSIINEDFGSGDESTEISNTEDTMASGDEYGDELGDETQNPEEGSEGEGEEGGEGEVVDELKDIITKLSDLISKLSGAEDEAEGIEGEAEEAEGEAEEVAQTEEPKEEDEAANKYEESLDLKGSLSELSDRLGELLQKKDNKVKGTLSKAKSGKASPGSIPTAAEKPTPFNPSIKHLQNPKGSDVVSNLKKGEYLFK